MSITKGVVGEFEFINRLKSRYGLARVGDDCAVLPKDELTDTVITADLLIEDIDFRLEWSTPEQIGHKALAVSLSDIAAMGASPTWAMVTIGMPSSLWKTDFAARFFEGWHKLAALHSVELIGGDISRTSGPIVIDSIAGGEIAKAAAILRSGARVDDHIYVSGSLGGSGGGLKLLESGQTSAKLLHKHLQPIPQVELGNLLLTGSLVNSMIDVSDGLSSDLAHICTASRVGAEIHRDRLPIDPYLREFFTPDECLELALNAGEDFELLLTAAREISLPGLTRIGRVTSAAGVIELLDGDSRVPLVARGFTHF